MSTLETLAIVAVVYILVFIAHRANIARLMNGSEGKISFRRAG